MAGKFLRRLPYYRAMLLKLLKKYDTRLQSYETPVFESSTQYTGLTQTSLRKNWKVVLSDFKQANKMSRQQANNPIICLQLFPV